MNAGKFSCRGGYVDDVCSCRGECFSGSEYERGAGVKGEGRPEPGCKFGWDGGGYWPGLVPDITSEIDGRDCRPGCSLSSEDRRCSLEIMLLPEFDGGGGAVPV